MNSRHSEPEGSLQTTQSRSEKEGQAAGAPLCACDVAQPSTKKQAHLLTPQSPHQAAVGQGAKI